MSHLPKEERPRLKAKRPNRFEPASSTSKTEKGDTNNITRRAYKRLGSDDGYSSFPHKRVCTISSPIKSTPVKNLALDRLKKLKEQIQISTNAERVTEKDKGNLPTKSVRYPKSECLEDVSPRLIKTSTNIASSNCSKRNLAEERLYNIKKNLSSEDLNENACSVSGPSNEGKKCEANLRIPQNSTWKNDEDKQRNSFKRITGNIANRNDSNLARNSSDKFLNKTETAASYIKSQDQSKCRIGTELDNNRLDETSKQNRDDKFNDGNDDMECMNIEPDVESAYSNTNVNKTNKEGEEIKVTTDQHEKIKNVCIVVDTNVFISGLSKIRDIVNLKITGPLKPIIFVPWMVITELDYMKDYNFDPKLLKSIVGAIKFINSSLRDPSSQVVGQTVFEAEKQKHVGASPDDKIIASCFQAAEKYETVILLSNDVNLKNKAMINSITACSSNEIVPKVMSKLVKNTKYQKISHKMGMMCSSIICDCMKAAYGNIWLRMDMMSYPPWSLAECLKRFKKYWGSVFREKLMKHFTKTLQDLQDVIQANKCISDDSTEFVEFMKLCVSLCIFLKDMEECRGFVENTLSDITKIA